MDMLHEDVETSVTVDQLHDGHGADEENDDFAGVAEGFHKVTVEVCVVSHHGVGTPEEPGHKQRKGGLVDVEDMFEGYAEIADYEQYNH